MPKVTKVQNPLFSFINVLRLTRKFKTLKQLSQVLKLLQTFWKYQRTELLIFRDKPDVWEL